MAGSAWGGGEPGGYVRSWRATANGLEGVALGHCDALLCLDELAQVAARDAGEVAYMLANGAGKSRSARDGSARRAARWRVLFLSSGEIGLSDKVAEDGRKRRLAAGQQVRVVDIPADAGAGLGLFEALHGFASAEALARHLRIASTSCYGTAARAFLERIAGDLERHPLGRRLAYARLYGPPRPARRGRSGAARGPALCPDRGRRRAGRRSRRAALAGGRGDGRGRALLCRLARRREAGWSRRRCATASPRCARSSSPTARPASCRPGRCGADQRLPARDVAGFRKHEGDGWDYFVTTSAWREEVCAGLNPSALAGALAERGLLLVPEKGPHRAKSITVPGHGKLRLYHLPARLLEGEGDD